MGSKKQSDGAASKSNVSNNNNDDDDPTMSSSSEEEEEEQNHQQKNAHRDRSLLSALPSLRNNKTSREVPGDEKSPFYSTEFMETDYFKTYVCKEKPLYYDPLFYIGDSDAKLDEGKIRYYDPSQFPFVADLEKNWTVIRDELLANLKVERDFIEWPEAGLCESGWNVFGLYGFGKRMESNIEKCPKTTEIVEKIPGLITAGFSSLQPNTDIDTHRGYYGYSENILRLHLGLIVPTDCALCVGGEVRTWQQGKTLLFDDIIKHSAWNHNKKFVRIVLLLDFLWEKDYVAKQKANKQSQQQQQQQSIGIGNADKPLTGAAVGNGTIVASDYNPTDANKKAMYSAELFNLLKDLEKKEQKYKEEQQLQLQLQLQQQQEAADAAMRALIEEEEEGEGEGEEKAKKQQHKANSNNDNKRK